MNKVGYVIEELYRSENDLAAYLVKASDRHKVDHEIFHLARDLAGWSQEHVRELARIGGEHGVDLDPEASDDHTLLARLRQKGSELLGRHHDVSLLLVHDLRRIHLTAARISLDWEILAQTAQALRDRELLAVARRCHPQTLRQMRWANAKLKEITPQAMVSA